MANFCLKTCLSAGAAIAALGFFSAELLAHGTNSHAKESADQPASAPVLAPGYEALAFPAPPVGSYTLPHIGAAADGPVIDSSGGSVTLGELIDNKITVLSFIYRACDDVNGCPLATYVMHQVRSQLEQHDKLAQQVRLISMSFDPHNDTAEAMQAYKNSFPSSNIDWRFITAPSVEALEPLLKAYDQPISRVVLEGGSSSINHLLRVFLIDASGTIRNVYSANLLHADTLYHDVLTLEQEARLAGSQVLAQTAAPLDRLAIDARTGYRDGSYTSESKSLTRQTQSVDLIQSAALNALGLPERQHPINLSKEKIALGRELFYDRRLSINDTFSCAMCHVPQQGFTSNELKTSVGVEGRTVKRNAPSLFNVGYAKNLFHDARESKLDQQVWSPLLAHNEMANPSVGYVLNKISALPHYAQQFDAVYGNKTVSMQSLGDALAAYQQALVAGSSPFDYWHFAAQDDAVSETAKLGFELFTGKAGCSACHTVSPQSAMFSDYQLHNTGVGYQQSMQKLVSHEVTLAPGIVVTVDPASYAAASEPRPSDLGYYDVTLNPADRWKFKTPTLRNVALTAPYMHNGSLATLADVVQFYNEGGVSNPVLSPLMKPLALTQHEQGALVAFMQSLTGAATTALMNDGMAAPIGDFVSQQ